MIEKKLIRVTTYCMFFICLVTLNSCSDDLEEELKGQLSESNISTESDATALIDGIYNGLLAGGWDYYASGVLARATDGITDVFILNDSKYRPLETYDWSDEDISADLWASIYTVVDRANWAILLIEGIDETAFKDVSREQLIAEAKFLRGLAYYDLTGLFGSVPLKLEPTQSDEVGLARTDLEAVYVQIEADFEYASTYLPGKSYTPGKASKGAAYGLLAKTQLRQLKWEEAGANIDNLIALGDYNLFTESNFLELFYESNVLDDEFIFSVMSLGESYSTASNHHLKFFTPWGYDTGWATVGLPVGIYNEIESEDERNEVYFEEYPYLYGGAIKNAIDDFGFAINRKFGSYNRDVTAPGTGYVAYQNYGISKMSVPVLRYSDVLLLKAEIENELNGPNTDAYNAINQVRNRSGLANLTEGLSSADFKAAVLKERAIELAGEGQRKDDLIRQGVFVSTLNQYALDQGYSVTITKDYQLMPIPRTELDLNPNMEPNPSNNF
ncbi:RagB/SusD family nutrient uptake outer membrane protein [uncultured Formosa sp.]|uniref:RagB/SusD family nutrient uptake outer membrane protein n=1 Tax=uncultured Formosa sp. TaxID=255435 RepID=UPI00260BBA6A|nr:RagB/SusD family nutrient uptake outer membrane protein [uncultured Formosa sp.]